MSQKLSFIFLILILIVASFLRFYNLSGRSTFEWDQERDHQAVSLMLKEKKPLLVGPVTQGQGGFMLGPLYYYLLIPAYLIFSGDPLAQPVTSLILDLVVIVSLYFLGNRLRRPPFGLIVSTLWAFSAYTVRLSFVSWNVSLVPLYTLGSLVIGHLLSLRFRSSYLVLALFWWGLSWHVHPSVAIQIPLALWLTRRHLSHLPLREWSRAVLAFCLPLLPWALFDFRHEFTNSKLLFNFLGSSSLPDSLVTTLISVWQKYAFELSQLIFGRQLLLVGTVLIFSQFLYLFITRRQFLSHFLAANLFLSFAVLILMRSSDFGNYYLLSLLLTNVWILSTILISLRLPWRLLFIALFLLVNFRQYRFATEPYSLAVKLEVLETIAAWNNPVDLEISLPVGRRSAFDWYLANRSSLRHDDSAPNVAYLVESDQLEINAPEKARSVVIERTIGGFRFVGYEANPSVK